MKETRFEALRTRERFKFIAREWELDSLDGYYKGVYSVIWYIY